MKVFRAHILVCGGTGCHATGSAAVLQGLHQELAAKGLSDEVAVVETGCNGFCAAGPIMVKAANEGRSLVDLAPRDGITADFAILADRVLGRETQQPAKTGFRLFGKPVAVRA